MFTLSKRIHVRIPTKTKMKAVTCIMKGFNRYQGT